MLKPDQQALARRERSTCTSLADASASGGDPEKIYLPFD
jgi:hypothetical protein